MNEILIPILCVAGCVAVLLAAIGLARFPDFFTRTHAVTKASAFGLAIILVCVCLRFPEGRVILKSLFAIVALFLTLPVASQALADAMRGRGGNDDG